MNHEESIFAAACDLPVEQRCRLLKEVCGDDCDLRQRLDKLLDAHDLQNGILDVTQAGLSQSAVSANADFAEGQHVGPYRLMQKLGEGGFGVVFLAQQNSLVRRQVAIKVIKPGMDSKAVVARFEAERQALAMMDHPNIARVFDGGSTADGQRPYFVMELVQGVPITEFCDANAMSVNDRLKLFITVCNAVHHAHQKGIIHRDIKPSNVMVTLHDGRPVVKVIDFGISKALHQRLSEKTMFTQYGAMVGTPQYMAPEQAEMTELDVDTRSDVYSLAVLLYELMTGTTPLEPAALRSAGYQEIQRMIRECEPVRPSLRLSSSGEKLTVLAQHRGISPDRLSKELRGDLDWIIMKGLEKDRQRRYDSPSDFADDIQRALSNQVVLAGPPSWTYRTRKFVLRNRTQLAFAVAVAALIVATGIGLLNNRRHVLAARQQEAARLDNAIDDAQSALVAAVDASTSTELWKTADLAVDRVEKLSGRSDESSPNPVDALAHIHRAEKFLGQYAQARQDHEFERSMEELLINRSTDETLESWQVMEREFRNILRQRGYDLQQLTPDRLARQLRADRATLKVTDAFELWLATRMKISDAGGQPITGGEVEQWTAAMCTADPNAMRTAIRQTIFHTVPFSRKSLSGAVLQADLAAACPRKLSWLSQAFGMVGDAHRSQEIRQFALAQHPDDLMLNFDYAMMLVKQQQSGEAIRYLMRCTAIRPHIPAVWRALASALADNGELKPACHAIRKAIELDPYHAPSRLRLAEWLLSDGNALAAIDSADSALARDGSLVSAWRIIGRANMLQKKYAAALVALEKYQKLSANSKNASDEIDEASKWLDQCRRTIAAGTE